ncbi:MAG: isoprenylcysteine carboxylmethyltransferase family protein [Candidatus Manganitrophaceae bacterium]
MKDHPKIIAPPPLIYLSGWMIGWLLERVVPLPTLPEGLRYLLGLPPIAIAAFFIFSAFRAMREAQTAVNPYQPTTAIVTSGPYRFTRNPLYLSLTLLYLGISFLWRISGPILLLPLVLLIIRWGVINREETYLENKFGEEYLRYKAGVRRWF